MLQTVVYVTAGEIVRFASTEDLFICLVKFITKLSTPGYKLSFCKGTVDAIVGGTFETKFTSLKVKNVSDIVTSAV